MVDVMLKEQLLHGPASMQVSGTHIVHSACFYYTRSMTHRVRSSDITFDALVSRQQAVQYKYCVFVLIVQSTVIIQSMRITKNWRFLPP